MADHSNIEWTEATLNIVTGCTKVSPGCDHCYIERTPPFRMAGRRFDKPGVGGKIPVQLHRERLIQALRWKRPRRIFMPSLGDLFHADVPDDLLVEAFAVMAVTPRHTYQITTKRPARMRSVLSDDGFWSEVGHDIVAMDVADQLPDARTWVVDLARRPFDHQWYPLPNVWLGVSVEDQKRADLRIPALLDTPAAVRWLSCEPLLGPVDLSQWIGAICGCPALPGGRGLPSGGVGRVDHRLGRPGLAGSSSPGRPLDGDDAADPMLSAPGGAPGSELLPGAGDVQWDSGARDGAPPGLATPPRADSRGPHGESPQWRQDGQPAEQPGVGDATGAGRARAARPAPGSAQPVGTAELDGEANDGAGAGDLRAPRVRGAAACPRCGFRRPGTGHLANSQRRPALSWLVVGGESGPGARPMHPTWARSLRDQCTGAGVPFFFKQWGEWAPADDVTPEQRERAPEDFATDQYICRVGKKAAGRVLDGRTWDEYPEVHRAG